jgi:hypothetical protein
LIKGFYSEKNNVIWFFFGIFVFFTI